MSDINTTVDNGVEITTIEPDMKDVAMGYAIDVAEIAVAIIGVEIIKGVGKGIYKGIRRAVRGGKHHHHHHHHHSTKSEQVAAETVEAEVVDAPEAPAQQ